MEPFELALVITSALLHAVWSTAIKGSRDPLVFNLLQGAFSVAAGAVVLSQVEIASISPALWRWLAVTSVAHGLYIYWLSRALECGDLTLVYPIARSTPALLPLVAVPLFGESLTAVGGLGIAIVVGGLWLVQAGAGLDWRALRSPAARYAGLTLLATVGYSVADKGAMLELREHPVARTQLWSATAASVVSLLGYGAILKALETAPASYVVAVRQASVFFALLLGVVLLGERPGRARALGAVATVLGVALIARFGS